ncbi:hypothetical protein J8273_0535 [Carpediemonas membranifera]|uniref:Uncharacterized protein n=1 Tax=Carpediemonas membranifera TaxID=201153 RepID=A0A8J6EAT3_9EUKA|nr:hypothetical protein J8273_0535 [Carpediemonas membranifera]|eukprot:KAG9395305.1 hypothetical protein J8273_0535 [Carpediemonas membranifera]
MEVSVDINPLLIPPLPPAPPLMCEWTDPAEITIAGMTRTIAQTPGPTVRFSSLKPRQIVTKMAQPIVISSLGGHILGRRDLPTLGTGVIGPQPQRGRPVA